MRRASGPDTVDLREFLRRPWSALPRAQNPTSTHARTTAPITSPSRSTRGSDMQSLITNLLLCCTLTACSGKVENVGASGGGCPSAPPVTGAQCTAPWTSSGGVQGASAHCSWGDDPRPACRTAALCQTDGTWLVTAPTAAACSEPALSSACPSTPPSSGTTCTDATVACW